MVPYHAFPWRKYYSLSLKDLLDARELYHYHLMNRKNVVATAVGLHLFRASDPLLLSDDTIENGNETCKNTNETSDNDNEKTVWPDEEKSLDNARLRPYSWPCILVFVKEWISNKDFYRDKSVSPEDMVPGRLYMPDSRIVPVCVVKAPAYEAKNEPVDMEDLIFPDEWIGGGFPAIKKIQGEERIASIGCLATDGHLVYAMTGRHVAGKPGEEIHTIRRGGLINIGRSSEKQLTRLEFQKAYGDWPCKNVYINLDVGLIEITDINMWTAQIYGIGTIGEMADLNCNTISLDLIGTPVRAFGCASHQMKGEIKGLFFRYKSLGGFEYIADFLIGPEQTKEGIDKRFRTQHGDSGTIWLLDTGKKKGKQKPFAIQWGGQIFENNNGNTRTSYALATCLSTVCNLLEIDIIRDLNIGLDEYWGGMGHYTIGVKACGMIMNKNLKKLMENNKSRISFEVCDINDRNLDGPGKIPFVPLADVPDLVWKSKKGRYFRPREGPCHFADMDKPDRNGKTLFDICEEDFIQNVDIDKWDRYYDDIGETTKGILPFRIWQVYKSMAGYVKKGQVTEFICAAGILAHYVGDACNPLHVSYLYDGDPDTLVPGNAGNSGNKRPKGKGIHCMYENIMIKYHSAEIIEYINNKTSESIPGHTPESGGKNAAIAVVRMMRDIYGIIPPISLIEAYAEVRSKMQRIRTADYLWRKFGAGTSEIMYKGCRCLASLWENAWMEGNGDAAVDSTVTVEQDDLKDLYINPDFLPSLDITAIKSEL